MAYTSDNEDKELLSRVEDLADLSFTRHKPVFLGFLNEREQYIINNTFPFYSSNISFFGGYDGAKRRILCFSGEELLPDFPIEPIYFKFRKSDKLSHRDFLGALMNLGIERNCVGDIVVNEGEAVCFVKEDIAEYICSQLSKIGRVGVRIVKGSECDIDYGEATELLSLIVSSMRLDVVCAAIIKLSREKTANLILSGKVFTNYFENKNVSCVLKQDDILTIRGYGKFIVKEQLGTTKKGRIKINIVHYR